jgi:hypothetical protein
MLKGILRHRAFSLNDEIEEVTPSAWNDLPFDDVETFFRKWMSRLAWLIKKEGECTLGKAQNNFLMANECDNRRGSGLFTPVLAAWRRVSYALLVEGAAD